MMDAEIKVQISHCHIICWISLKLLTLWKS